MAKLFVIFLILHLIGDFLFQCHDMCEGKYKNGMCGYHLYLHVLIIFIVYFVTFLSFSLLDDKRGLPYALDKGIIVGCMFAIPHLLIDALKSSLEKTEIWVSDDKDKEKYKSNNKTKVKIHGSPYEIWTFLVDQVLHFITIFVFTCVLTRINWTYPSCVETIGFKNLVFVLMLIFCGKPANILTKEILISRHIIKEEPDYLDKPNEKFDPQTGKFIGTIERSLILFFMFVKEFSAIGFLITAKSILRFNDAKKDKKKDAKDTEAKTEGAKTVETGKVDDSQNNEPFLDRLEYILVGTFVSISIAVFCGYLTMISDKSKLLSSVYEWLQLSFLKS